MPTVYLGADHAGLALKNTIADHLRLRNFVIEDLGAHQNDPEDDYPEYAGRVAAEVRRHRGSFGILVCGSAEGMCMAANKFDGIRAGIGFSAQAARAMRNDDDANIVCIPSRIKTGDDVFMIVDTFLDTPFSHEPRHARRIERISDFERADE